MMDRVVDSVDCDSVPGVGDDQIVDDLHAVPAAVEDRDAVQIVGGQHQAGFGLGDDDIAVDDDVGIHQAGLVVPVPALDAVGMDAFVFADVVAVGDAVVQDAQMAGGMIDPVTGEIVDRVVA